MTKHATFVADDAATAPAQAGQHLSSFPPLVTAGARDCKKHAAVQMDLAAAGVVAGAAWVETMKSPWPRRATEEERGDWIESHPSALAWFESALSAAKGKQIVMFLDYDGTLSLIVKDPDAAVMSDEMRDAVRRVAEHFPTVSGRCIDKVLEIRSSINWDKGKALEFLLKSLGYAGRNDVFPIYIGDDRTDEDAFKVLRNIVQGIGILVSKFPKETASSYSLRDPDKVKEFLRKLVKYSECDVATKI